MKRGLAALFAVAALAACRPGEPVAPAPPRPPVSGLPSVEPTVRVGITVDSAAALVGASTDFTIRTQTNDVIARGRAGETWTFSADADGRISARGPASDTQPRAGPLRVMPEPPGGVIIGGRPYRGDALVISRAAGQITAVNVVELESYLLGVVPREIGRRPATEIEAMKAQAVAARTYAIGNLASRQSLGFDFYATVQDQVYGGVSDEDSIVSRAVVETRGEILTHGGVPIIAYYSSTCGGTTAAIEDSWPWRAPLPYLRSVSDRIPGTDDYYCSTSNRFNWTTRWTRDQLLAVLAETLRAHTGGSLRSVQRVDDVAITERNRSERVTVRLTADGSTYTLRADSVRWVLKPQPTGGILNSSKLSTLDARRGSDGAVQELELRGGGWGHGIGMCQVGAMGRARAGQNHLQILRAYYTDVELERLY